MNETGIPDAVMYLTVFLLEMSVTLRPENLVDTDVPVTELVTDGRFSEWYPSNNILKNIIHRIHSVSCKVPDLQEVEKHSVGEYWIAKCEKVPSDLG